MKCRRDVVLLLSVFAPFILGSVRARTNGVPAGGIEKIAGPVVEARRGTDRFITGVVTDQSGMPLAGVIVMAHCHITALGSDRYRWVFADQLNVPAATTGADGRFRIDGPEDGWYCLLVSPPSHAARIVYDVPAGTEDMVVKVRQGGTISGQVVQIQDAKKVPIPNVVVEVSSLAWDPYLDLGARKELEATTDSDGRFQFANLCTDQRDIYSVTTGREIRRPRAWRISAGGRFESIAFEEDGESKFVEFVLAREVHILFETMVLEITRGIRMDSQTAAQVHDSLVETTAEDGSDDAIGQIPSAADLTRKPRTVLARYLQDDESHRSVTKPFLELLETLGWVKAWASSGVLAEAGKKYELNAFPVEDYLMGGFRDYGQEWRALGYRNVPNLGVVVWPQDGDNAVRFELSVETWCGIRRAPDQPPRTDGLRKIAFSTKRTVADGASVIIPLWDCGQDAEIHEDEDLFFLTVQPRVHVSLTSSPDSATEPENVTAQKSVAKVVSVMLQVDDEFLEELRTAAPIQGVTAADDIEMLHGMGQRLSKGGPLLLSDAQVRVLTSAVEKRGGLVPRDLSQRREFTGLRGFSEAVSYIAGYDEVDRGGHGLIGIETTKFVDIGLKLDMRTRLLSDDAVAVQGVLRITSLKALEDKQDEKGRTYQVPRTDTVVYPIDAAGDSHR